MDGHDCRLATIFRQETLHIETLGLGVKYLLTIQPILLVNRMKDLVTACYFLCNVLHTLISTPYVSNHFPRTELMLFYSGALAAAFASFRAARNNGNPLMKPVDEVNSNIQVPPFLNALPSVIYPFQDLSEEAIIPIDQTTFDNLAKYQELASLTGCLDSPYLLEAALKVWPTAQIMNHFSYEKDDTITAAGFLAVDHSTKEIYLSFRGTVEFGDIQADLAVCTNRNFCPNGDEDCTLLAFSKQCPDCALHEGFLYEYHKSVERVGNEAYSTFQRYPDYQIIVVGHSLGGALAVIWGLALQSNGYLPKIITYGQPLVGNAPLNEYFNEYMITEGDWDSDRNYYRVTHFEDVVPRVPFWWPYQMQGGEVYMSRQNNNRPENVFFCPGILNKYCSVKDWLSFTSLRQQRSAHSDYFFIFNCTIPSFGDLTSHLNSKVGKKKLHAIKFPQ